MNNPAAARTRRDPFFWFRLFKLRDLKYNKNTV